jgi:hypothetical protein
MLVLGDDYHGIFETTDILPTEYKAGERAKRSTASFH